MQQSATVARGMSEQAAASAQIAQASASMHREAQQASQALQDQSRAIRQVADGAANTSKHIKTVSRAHAEHSTAAAELRARVNEARRITDRNAAGVKDTQGSTDELLAQARTLTELMAPGKRGGADNGARRTSGVTRTNGSRSSR
jgi:methyl-accepting chemotaxis protein